MFELGFVLILVILAIPVLALLGFLKSNANARALVDLRREVSSLSAQLADIRSRGVTITPDEPLAKSTSDAAPIEATKPVIPSAPAESTPSFEAAHETFEAGSAKQATSETPPPPPPPRTPEIKKLEDALTTRWLIWIGAVAIGLAGVFLVKYAVDNALLTPAMRVVLGLLLGLSLAAAGEVLRRKPLSRAIAAVRPNYVPPALTASGLFVAFASLYAGYVLYQLVPPLVAFAGLAVIALSAIGLSLLQGRFVALMGFLGAFVTPALVSSNEPSAWTLFSYLLVVEFACIALSRYRGWAWFALATLAGVAAWPLLWMLDVSAQSADTLPLGLYLLSSASAFFFLLRWGLPPEEGVAGWFEDFRNWNMAERAVAISGVVIAFLLFLVTADADYNALSLGLFAVMVALYLFAGRRENMFDALSVIAAVATIAVIATMPVPETISLPGAFARGPLIPRELDYFVRTAIGFGALFGVAGFVAQWGARRPAMWAGVSAFMPVTIFAIAYWRIVDFGVDLQWAGISVGLAALSLFAAERVERYRAARGLDVSLGLYAAGTVAFISLAATMSLREAWLTVALSLQLPALAAIALRIPARPIRVLAGIVAAIVITRLVLNYSVLSYPHDGAWLWILYGYGIPAAACFAAANLFRRTADDLLVVALQAAALAFAVLLVSLEIRIFIAGSLDAQNYTLLEASLQTIAWLAVGTGLAVRDMRSRSIVARIGSRILLGAATTQIVLLHLLTSNPLLTNEPVGTHLLIDVLTLAYLVPAVFAFAFSTIATDTDPLLKWQRPVAAVAAIVLLFVYISLEVRHVYHGPILSTPERGDAELYTYSAAWLVYAAILLGVGIRVGQPLLRYAGLAILMLTVVKVFLVDMGDLTGLYRVASFLGLGLSLVGIGWLYQRFVNTKIA